MRWGGGGIGLEIQAELFSECGGCQGKTATPHSKPGEPRVRVRLSPPGLPEDGATYLEASVLQAPRRLLGGQAAQWDSLDEAGGGGWRGQ